MPEPRRVPRWMNRNHHINANGTPWRPTSVPAPTVASDVGSWLLEDECPDERVRAMYAAVVEDDDA